MAEKQPNKRGAKPLAQAEPVGPDLDTDKLAERNQELVTMADAEATAAAGAGQLAKTVGYTGEITTLALTDGIRFYQSRTAEAALEIGKRLLLLKEITPHGHFKSEIEQLGFSPRMAQQFMSATLKFSKANTSSLLTKAHISQSNLLELIVLDDEEIQALDSGDSVNGITLDDIEVMSTRELRAALRETRADADAKDQRITKLSDDLNKAEEKTAKAQKKWKKATPDEQSQELLTQLELAASQVRLAIATGSEEAGFSGAVITLMQHAEQHDLNVDEQVAGIIASLINDLRLVRDHQEVGVTVIHDRRLADWKREG
ncbi:TPA: DUF3102 domain-containing protein [Stenotrophomonas maltophilia]|nr:DUF3102 domain-containing protein [Stenotrophomonas maltophilia]HEL7728505.1 DUF3102 domain-containing protein [Stenotrophomonas maltophilia]